MKRFPKPDFIFLISSLAIIISCMCRPVSANVVHLKNGNSVEGIAEDTRDGKVRLKVDIGTVKFSENEVSSIEKSSAEEKSALEATWEKAKKKPSVKKASSPASTAKQSVPSRISWVRNFNRGKEKAESSGKPMMVDCYTDWCGWCKKLDKDTFTDKTARAPGAFVKEMKKYSR